MDHRTVTCSIRDTTKFDIDRCLAEHDTRRQSCLCIRRLAEAAGFIETTLLLESIHEKFVCLE